MKTLLVLILLTNLAQLVETTFWRLSLDKQLKPMIKRWGKLMDTIYKDAKEYDEPTN